jgi:hypothetical protein
MEPPVNVQNCDSLNRLKNRSGPLAAIIRHSLPEREGGESVARRKKFPPFGVAWFEGLRLKQRSRQYQQKLYRSAAV